jgi:hypothetical protein
MPSTSRKQSRRRQVCWLGSASRSSLCAGSERLTSPNNILARIQGGPIHLYLARITFINMQWVHTRSSTTVAPPPPSFWGGSVTDST